MIVHLRGVAKRAVPATWQVPDWVPFLIGFDDREPAGWAHLTVDARGDLRAEVTLRDPPLRVLEGLRVNRLLAVRAYVPVTGWDCDRVLAVSAVQANVDADLARYRITVEGASVAESRWLESWDLPPARPGTA